jgi:hypothetical protein
MYAAPLAADQVQVRQPEGLIHGFLVLRDTDNNVLASGDVSQITNGARVTMDVVFHFKDGSVHEETTVFSQRRVFQLISYHLVQKGKSFKRSTDLRLNAATGKVTVISLDEKGKEQTISDQLKLPNDVANGLINRLFNDIDPKTPKTTVSMVVATPKPRIVTVAISPEGEDEFSIGGVSRKATRYVVKINIGGVAGVVAPLVGKQPKDTHVWMQGGTAPVLLKSEGQLYEDGPVWRIELASPVWADAEHRAKP